MQMGAGGVAQSRVHARDYTGLLFLSQHTAVCAVIQESVDGDREELIPARLRDSDVREVERLLDTFGARHADDRGCDTWVAKRELKRRRGERDIVPRANRFHPHGVLEDATGHLRVGIARVFAGSLCENPASVRSSIQERDVPLVTEVDEWIG